MPTDAIPQSLVTLGLADRMLAEVATVDDAREIINLAERARVYARQNKLGTSAINHATVIKVRGERALADVVDEGQARGEIATPTTGAPGGIRNQNTSTLDELGIDAPRLAEARTLRNNYTDEQLADMQREADEADEVLSRQSLLRHATKANAANAKVQEERVTVQFPIFTALAALSSCPLSAREFSAAVLPASAYRINGTIDEAHKWLTALKEEWPCKTV